LGESIDTQTGFKLREVTVFGTCQSCKST
jgi:hypothetical protein